MAASIGFNAQNQFTVGGTALDYGRNFIINGGFDYWNYATSQTTSGYGSDDRWVNGNVGSTKTHSLVNATDIERVLFNSSKFSRTVVASVAGTGNFTTKAQYIENVTKLAGKTVTISFWAKADSNKNIAIELHQMFGTGGAPSAITYGIGSQLVALTSIWQKKSITITMPSIVGKTLGTDGVHTSYTRLLFWFDAGSDFNTRTASLGNQSGTFDIAEVKLEVGTVDTPWTPYEGEFGGEVQACGRYLPKLSVSNSYIYIGACYTSTYMAVTLPFSVPTRIAPSGIIISNANLRFTSTVGAPIGTGASFSAATTTAGAIVATGVTTGVAGQATSLQTSSGITDILFTGCEL